MNKTLLLVKISLRESLDTRQLKDNKKKVMSFGVFVGLMGILFLAIATLYSVIYAFLFRQIGVNLIYEIAVMGGIASMLILTTSVTRAKGIFISKDYEMLRAMPFTREQIVASKLISMYLVELLYAAIIMIPCCIVCSIIGNNPIYAILMIPVTLLLPGLPVVIGCLLGLFVALVADRSKFGNVISILFYAAFFVVVMLFSYSMNGMEGGDMGGLLALTYLNPTLLLVVKGVEGNFLWFIAYVAVNLIALAISTWILAGLFDMVYAVVSSAKGGTKYKAKALKQKGMFSTLFKNEAKRYFSSKLYCINTMSSGLCAVLLSVMVPFSLRSVFESDPEFMAILPDYMYLGALLIQFGIGIATPASVSISMEGSMFWLTKTLPIDRKKLVKAKIWFSVLVLGVFSLIASVVLVVTMKASLLSAIALILAPLFFVLGASSLGLLLNASFYKLRWKNEAEVVKNSASVIVSMLADFGITILMIGVGVASAFLPQPFGAILLTATCALFGFVLYAITVSVADDKIGKIEDF